MRRVGTLAVRSSLALVVLAALAGGPAAAQQPEAVTLPVPPAPVIGPACGDGCVAARCGGCKGCGGGCFHECADKPMGPWEAFVRSGPVFTLGNGFLETHVQTGWEIQAGLREYLWTPRPAAAFYHEVAADFVSNHGDDTTTLSRGNFRGLNPDETVVHFVQNGALATAPVANVAAPSAQGPLLTNKLGDLDRGSIHYALGAEYLPGWFNGAANRQVAFGLRGGVRGGYVSAGYEKTLNPLIEQAIRQREAAQPNGTISFSNTGAKNPDAFFGLFTAVGVTVTYSDLRWWGRFPGSMTLGAEVEFASEWLALGDYAPKDTELMTFTPMFTLGFRF